VPSKVFVLEQSTHENTFCKVLIDVFQSEMMSSDVTGILDLDQLDGPVISRLLQVCHARKEEFYGFNGILIQHRWAPVK
jgi:hypothetical protein